MSTLILILGMIAALTVVMLVAHARRGGAGSGSPGQLRRRLRGLAEPVFEKDRLRAIRVRCRTALRFSIRVEDTRTAAMRERGELRELQTGDTLFDRRLYLECDDTRVRDWLRGDGEARELISALVRADRALHLGDGHLSLASPGLEDTAVALQEHARRLLELAGRVPSAVGEDPAMATQHAQLRRVRQLSFATLGLGFLAAIVAIADPILHTFPQHVRLWPLLLGAGLAGCLLATLVHRHALRLVRHSSHAPRLAAELFVSLWLPLAASTVVLLHQCNLRIGAGGERSEESTVIGLESYDHGRSSSHYFLLPALDQGRIPAARYDSTRAINNHLRQGQRVRVYWREGPLASHLITREPEPVREAADQDPAASP